MQVFLCLSTNVLLLIVESIITELLYANVASIDCAPLGAASVSRYKRMFSGSSWV